MLFGDTKIVHLSERYRPRAERPAGPARAGSRDPCASAAPTPSRGRKAPCRPSSSGSQPPLVKTYKIIDQIIC